MGQTESRDAAKAKSAGAGKAGRRGSNSGTVCGVANRGLQASTHQRCEQRPNDYRLKISNAAQGIIPRNSFGNIDLYVPTMLPLGAVHLPCMYSMGFILLSATLMTI